jgi:DNA helicase-2/ATP-dependent DNA helicase PcrA
VKIYKYAGPPGTGKSTALLNVLDRLLAAGVPSEDIVFTTFTRAGAHEAKERAIRRFNLPPARLPYFKTLHALCYGQINRHVNLMSASDWCEIAKKIGVFFSVRISEDGVPRGSTKGDALLSLWSLSRVLIAGPEFIWDRRDKYVRNFPSLTYQEFQHFIDTVRNYKASFSKLDYTDLLELFLMEGQEIGASHVIVDEAQDLSPLQWAVVRKLTVGSKELHIAGDDDQAIHEWNGASPGFFIDHRSDDYQVLPQSHRIPAAVHELAIKIVSRIKTRLPKTYRPREERGEVLRFSSLDDPRLGAMLKTEESWFLLARNHAVTPVLFKFCRDRGLLVSGASGGLPDGLLGAIFVWKRLCNSGTASKEEVVNLYRWMSTRDRVAYGSKTALQKSDKTTFTHQQLRELHGMKAGILMPWSVALDKAMPEDVAYLQAVEKRGPLDQAPKVEIATIHAVKGREADNVLILPDMTHQTHQGFMENEDAEHRVWYVGVTRARKRILILNPSSKYHYNL